MIVDDVEDNIFLTEHLLLKYGAETITATGGEEALEKYQNIPNIHIIITDLRMPGMSGCELIQKIRAYEQITNKPHIPIIVLSGESDPEERTICLSNYGANEYLLKPVQINELMDALYRVTLKSHSRKQDILIVDDDSLSSYCLARVFTEAGHSVEICPSISDVFLLLNANLSH